jgi:putative membrane protein
VTTGSTASQVPFRSNRFLQVLIALFVVYWIWSAIAPEIPEDWLLENLLVFLLLGVLAVTYRWLTFSELSYLLIFLFLCLHECGAHYQYSDAVPGEWMKSILHTRRNDYDRLVHCAFGVLLAYPQRELLMRKARIIGGWAYILPVLTTLALSAAYEIIEAVVASSVDPADAAAFLGLQGDPWDSQEDMFMGLAGACAAMVIVALIHALQRGNAFRAASTAQ